MSTSFYAQIVKKSHQYSIRTIAFYNLENLFDTVDDSSTYDETSPIMESSENRVLVYRKKIENMAYVISQIGRKKTNTSPVIIGVCEVENKGVLDDLIMSKYLRDKGYEIIHYNSPDKRGIDVALLYQSKYFNPIHHQIFNPNIYKENRKVYTRDQLLVSGYLDDDLVHIIVNHWPSRSGGEEKSRPLREKAAYQNKRIIEQIRSRDENPKILIMGDFNDDPTNSSLKEVLKTKSDKNKIKENDIYNPYENLFQKGLNTLGHRDHLNLFDMILVSSHLIPKKKNDYSTYKLFQSKIFNESFLITRDGKFKGYPFRSFSNGVFTGGYSDHFPVYVYLIKSVP